MSCFSSPEDDSVSLLELIGDPPPDEIPKVEGPDNKPGYLFGPDTNTGQLALAHFPSSFYRNFALIFSVKPTSDNGGVLFSITDSSQEIMHVGVRLSAVQEDKQEVVFYYTETDSEQSKEAARFHVPTMTETWNRFAISVRDDMVTLYLNCDGEPQVKRMKRSTEKMALKLGAGVFVGRNGGSKPDKFEVRTQDVTAFN